MLCIHSAVWSAGVRGDGASKGGVRVSARGQSIPTLPIASIAEKRVEMIHSGLTTFSISRVNPV